LKEVRSVDTFPEYAFSSSEISVSAITIPTFSYDKPIVVERPELDLDFATRDFKLPEYTIDPLPQRESSTGQPNEVTIPLFTNVPYKTVPIYTGEYANYPDQASAIQRLYDQATLDLERKGIDGYVVYVNYTDTGVVRGTAEQIARVQMDYYVYIDTSSGSQGLADSFLNSSRFDYTR